MLGFSVIYSIENLFVIINLRQSYNEEYFRKLTENILNSVKRLFLENPVL